jgi:hypothetical protein
LVGALVPTLFQDCQTLKVGSPDSHCSIPHRLLLARNDEISTQLVYLFPGQLSPTVGTAVFRRRVGPYFYGGATIDKGSYDASRRSYFTDVDPAKAATRRAVLDKWTRRIEPPRDRAPSQHRGREEFREELAAASGGPASNGKGTTSVSKAIAQSAISYGSGRAQESSYGSRGCRAEEAEAVPTSEGRGTVGRERRSATACGPGWKKRGRCASATADRICASSKVLPSRLIERY